MEEVSEFEHTSSILYEHGRMNGEMRVTWKESSKIISIHDEK